MKRGIIMKKIENVSLSALEAFVSENDGECIDFAEGSLIDNVVYAFSNGIAFCFETYKNPWNSVYTVLFFYANRERGIEKAWNQFEARKNPV